ncbi:hypothetical protein HH213_08555 [Duganella dendranthematis]|uniref:DUF559 domain-containing protein n=1 Tax=Duganella dendranthematis TaxID=2728021 RepID=A0ABX6M748_9BURK|nr:hypothetical protein [Duganella dendranthematis]QJD90142.1 hypothetical protein HH213_08555 [Duganella dendranthematis]
MTAKARLKNARHLKKARRNKTNLHNEFHRSVYSALEEEVNATFGHRVQGKIIVVLGTDCYQYAPKKIAVSAEAEMVFTPDAALLRRFGMPDEFAKHVQRQHNTKEFSYVMDSYDPKNVGRIVSDLVQEFMKEFDDLEAAAPEIPRD